MRSCEAVGPRVECEGLIGLEVGPLLLIVVIARQGKVIVKNLAVHDLMYVL